VVFLFPKSKGSKVTCPQLYVTLDTLDIVDDLQCTRISLTDKPYFSHKVYSYVRLCTCVMSMPCMRVRVHVRARVRVHVHVCVRVRARVCVCVCVCV